MEPCYQGRAKLEMWLRNKISKYRIANELGVSWQTVHNWIRGRHVISRRHLLKINELEIKIGE